MNAFTEKIVEYLDAVYDRPGSYFRPVDYDSALNFIQGFAMGVTFGRTHDYGRVQHDVVVEHGWEPLSTGFLEQFQAASLSDLEMAKELIAIERDIWRKITIEF